METTHTTFFSTKGNRTLGAVALVMFILALGAYSVATWKQSEYMYFGPTTISVTGEGEVNATPDIGQFSFSVNASGADASQAKEVSGKAVNDLLAFLKEKGVEDKDIKTEYYNMSEKYKYETTPCPINNYCPPEEIKDGFEVMQTIMVKVRNLDSAKDLISGVGDRGATNISNLQFAIDDDSVLKEEARALAIEDAKTKGKALAEKLGVRIEKMSSYYEEENYYEPYYSEYSDMSASYEAKEAFGGAELPAGEQTTKSRVTITYQVK